MGVTKPSICSPRGLCIREASIKGVVEEKMNKKCICLPFNL